LGFSAVALIGVVMKAGKNRVEIEFALSRSWMLSTNFARCGASGNVGLIGHHDKRISMRLQCAQCLGNVRQDFKIPERNRWYGFPSRMNVRLMTPSRSKKTAERVICSGIPISFVSTQEAGEKPRDARSPLGKLRSAALRSPRLQSEQSRTRPRLLRYGRRRGRVSDDFCPDYLGVAGCAATKLALMFFSTLPPPTDKMKYGVVTYACSLLSHSTNVLSQPSSLMRE